MEIREELEKIILQLGLNNPKLELELTPTGRIGGFIISDSFLGKSQIERQNMLWDKLDNILDEEINSKVIGLLTMTPDEVEETDAA